MSKRRVKSRRLPLLVVGDYKGVTEIPTRKNFIPLLLPVLTVMGVGVGGVMVIKKLFAPGPKISAILSAPVIIGAGGAYVAGESIKATPEMKMGLTLVGGAVGWAIQYYAIAPIDEQREAEAAAAAEAEKDANFRWYNPFSWA
jgi:hypothetical protein